MTRGELIDMITSEVTSSGALPYSIPEREVERIITQALNWFYINYAQSVETQYYVIEQKYFNDPEFKRSRSIQLPECVISVYEVKEITGGGRLKTIDKDFSDNRLFAADLAFAPFDSDNLVLRTAQYAFWDLTQAFILERIAYDFNANTRKLKILGRDPSKNVFLQTYVKIDEAQLYEDWFFQRYCTAQAKMVLGRILGAFQFNLPGGVQINGDLFTSEGKEELEEIKQKIEDENSPSWFMIFH